MFAKSISSAEAESSAILSISPDDLPELGSLSQLSSTSAWAAFGSTGAKMGFPVAGWTPSFSMAVLTLVWSNDLLSSGVERSLIGEICRDN